MSQKTINKFGKNGKKLLKLNNFSHTNKNRFRQNSLRVQTYGFIYNLEIKKKISKAK